MINKYSFQTQGILLALFAMFTFSINDGVFKYFLQLYFLETIIFVGYLFSAVCLAAYGGYKKISFMPQKKSNGLIYGLFFLIEQSLFVYALKYLPLAELFVVILSTPVFVLILSSFILKEHLQRQDIIAVACGFAGAIIVVTSPLTSNEQGLSLPYTAIPWIAALLNVIVGSGKIIYLRKYCKNENTFSLSFIPIVMVAALYLFLMKSSPFILPLFDLAILFIGGALGAVGAIAYTRAFQIAKAALVSAAQYSQILWAVLMGVFIFDEALTSAAICGSLLILISDYLLYVKKSENPLH